jgi:electron-transferring-flavoprotein dehydrogenase
VQVATKDAGISKSNEMKDSFVRGVELHARHTVFAEGSRGSCSEDLIEKFDLRKGKNVQSYGIGIKEVWEVPEEELTPGLVQHTLGWPLQSSPVSDVYGGTFLYHMKPNLILMGMVVGLDYKNPYLNPYQEFQRWKTHPEIQSQLKNGRCVAYGARCLNEGGYHSIPKLTVPGAVLIGCSAGFLNSVKIKGSHTAIKSGMLAAEAIYPLLTKDGEAATVLAGADIGDRVEAVEYEKSKSSSIVFSLKNIV